MGGVEIARPERHKIIERISIEQERVNQELWLPMRAEINLSARVALLKDFNIARPTTIDARGRGLSDRSSRSGCKGARIAFFA